MTTDRQYHAIVRGQQQGPFDREEMVQLAARGEIGPDTMAWTDGMTIWRPLPQVPGLQSLLSEVPAVPVAATPDSLLPDAVDEALDRVSRSQAFIIGAGLFFALIAILGIGNIFAFRNLAFLSFWGSAALAYFAYQAWRQEENEDFTPAAGTSFRAAIGSWVLAAVSLAFGNFFFGALQAGAGLLFWLARVELVKQEPTTDVTEAADGRLMADDPRPTIDSAPSQQHTEPSEHDDDPPEQGPLSGV